MDPQVEYLDPYGGTLRQTSPARQLWFPALCLLAIFIAAVTAMWVEYSRGMHAAQVAPPIAAAPHVTPGPSTSILAGDEPIDEEVHNLCRYAGRRVESEDNVAAVVERYACATTTVVLRLDPTARKANHGPDF